MKTCFGFHIGPPSHEHTGDSHIHTHKHTQTHTLPPELISLSVEAYSIIRGTSVCLVFSNSQEMMNSPLTRHTQTGAGEELELLLGCICLQSRNLYKNDFFITFKEMRQNKEKGVCETEMKTSF